MWVETYTHRFRFSFVSLFFLGKSPLWILFQDIKLYTTGIYVISVFFKRKLEINEHEMEN